MSALAISGIVLVCVFGSAVLGIFLRSLLPDHHLDSDAKDTVKQALALLATMSALVLGLLIASAKSSYDARAQEVTKLATDIIMLDWVLDHFGPETNDARLLFHQMVAAGVERIWQTREGPATVPAAIAKGASPGAALYGQIEALSPRSEAQRALQARALQMALELGQTRLIQFQQINGSIPLPFLLALIFWLCLIFTGFGLFAPGNATVIAVFFVSSLSVSVALFLIIELDRSFEGLVQVSSAPLRDALAHITSQ